MWILVQAIMAQCRVSIPDPPSTFHASPALTTIPLGCSVAQLHRHPLDIQLVTDQSLIVTIGLVFKTTINDPLNTFHMWLYSIGHVVKDQSTKEETRWLQGILYMHHPPSSEGGDASHVPVIMESSRSPWMSRYGAERDVAPW